MDAGITDQEFLNALQDARERLPNSRVILGTAAHARLERILIERAAQAPGKSLLRTFDMLNKLSMDFRKLTADCLGPQQCAPDEGFYPTGSLAEQDAEIAKFAKERGRPVPSGYRERPDDYTKYVKRRRNKKAERARKRNR